MLLTRRKRYWLLIGIALTLGERTWGQRTLNWRVFKAADGLAQSVCVSVAISPQDRVLVRHLAPPMFSELDGYTIKTYSLPEAGSGRIYERGRGEFWASGPRGLQEYKGGTWLQHTVPEIFNAHRTAVPFLPLTPRHVLFLLPDGLWGFNSENPERPLTVMLRSASQSGIGKFSNMALSRDDGLWVSGEKGLAKLSAPLRTSKIESAWRESVPPAELSLENFLEPREGDDGSVTMVAEVAGTGERVVAHFDGQKWSSHRMGIEKLQAAWRGMDKTDWAMTRRSLFQWREDRAEAVENEEMTAGEYFDVATEPGGVFWLATSEGLFRCAPLTWRTPASAEGIHSLVHGLAGDADGRLWWVSGVELYSLQNEELRAYALPGTIGRNLTSCGLFPMKDGKVVLVVGGEPGVEGGKGDQLFVLRPNHGQCEAALAEIAGEIKVLGSTKDHRICIQRVDQEGTETNYNLETFDGVSFEPLGDASLEAALGSVLHSWFTTQSGDIWVSGPRGTAWRHEKKWRIFSQLDKTTPEGGLYFAELADGKICCATREQLWMFDGRNWALLKRGFERISSMVRARDGSLWVGANNGLYRWTQGAWLENGSEEGLPGPGIRELHEDARGVLWAGTTHGLSEYHPEADVDPPKTRILQPQGESLNIPDGDTITVTFSGQDKWKYTPRERLLYSYQLDQRDWSPFEEANGVAFGDLPVGKHSFQVRAMDRNGNIEVEPARVEFSVILPWYREARLLMIGLAGLGAALFFAVLSYNRHRKLVLSYGEVERKVRQRTDELALANRELLHSQKMNALGTLAAGIAHDFNNILSIIKGSAQIIEENIENPDKIRTRVERINTVVEQGTGTVKALLGFSRDSDQQPGPCDLNAVVEDTIRLLGDRFLREVQVRFEPGTGLPEGRALKDFVQQILLNFIFNAAESMENEKAIVLSTREAEELPRGLVLKPEAGGPYVLISVRDHGCGIATENLSRIFEPFFTTKALSTRRGTGLGLSMVYELARKMGAGLAVETAVGIGSTFTLIVPAQPAPAVARTANEQQ